MENLVYILFISLNIPLFMMIWMLDKKSRRLVLFLILGMIVCILASEVNPIIAYSITEDWIYATTTITPIIEEILKAIPIIFYALFISNNKQSILEVSMAIGIGFALLENVWSIVTYIDNVTILWAFIRGFGSALMHGVCCLVIGNGLIYIKTQKKLLYTGIFAILSVSITYHAIYNSLVQSANPYSGIILPILTYIPILLFLKKEGYLKKDNLEH